VDDETELRRQEAARSEFRTYRPHRDDDQREARIFDLARAGASGEPVPRKAGDKPPHLTP
jgi:hypothetical protein